MIKKRIDALGRVVLPKGMLLQLNWEKGDELSFFADVEEGSLKIKKTEAVCIDCGEKKDLIPIKGNVFLCGVCLQKVLKKIK